MSTVFCDLAADLGEIFGLAFISVKTDVAEFTYPRYKMICRDSIVAGQSIRFIPSAHRFVLARLGAFSTPDVHENDQSSNN